MFEDTPRTHQHGTRNPLLYPEGVAVETNKRKRNWEERPELAVYLFITESLFNYHDSNKNCIFLFQVGVIEKEIAGPAGHTAANKTLI